MQGDRRAHRRAAAAPFIETRATEPARHSRCTCVGTPQARDLDPLPPRRRGFFSRAAPPPQLPEQEIRDTLYYGWLWKKGSSFKTWKQRFFLLNGCALTYYTRSCMVTSDRFGTRCLDMPIQGGLRVARAEMTDATEFGIKITSTSGRELYVQAGDETARMQWLCAFHEAAKQKELDLTLACLAAQEASASCDPPTSEESSSLSAPCSRSTLSSDHDHASPHKFGRVEKRGWLNITTRATARSRSLKHRYVLLANGRLLLLPMPRAWRPQDATVEILSVARWLGHEHGLHLQLSSCKSLFVEAACKEDCAAWQAALLHSL